ncbi:hypothetical protein FVR03_06780 [Pontibacter qinzhouensis]|uniref:Uncharacterized protein n=1 Tax=Pontibacter qinzhouensis TaxID=2603253 RepID=A0A5C8KCV1_9BACT|nr:hypothetical protein [Pontibacter qinzhouensis]TXK49262.1 hypothetical protein FVR03_06780 [Pontibacter qinzhouensis]
MKELDKLRKGLKIGDILLIEDYGNTLKCIFMAGGLAKSSFIVKDDALVEALRLKGDHGILEGASFHAFKNTFDSFALHVKARKLYDELSYNLPLYMKPEVHEDEVLKQAVA